MALRNQPYIPLYVNDFLTDEKLIECSAESTGVYIRLMCLMHKAEEYGTISIKEKDKQSDDQITNFAKKLVKLMPYTVEVIKRALNELIEEDVILLSQDRLIQRRMVADNSLSIIRSKVGQKGGLTRKNKGNFAIAKPQAKPKANTEYEYEYINEDNIGYKEILEYLNNKTNRNYSYKSKKNQEMIKARFNEGYTIDDFKKVIDNKCSDWLNDDKMNEYLRPETLFSNKFDGYLNKKRKKTIDEMVEEME